MKQFYLLIIVSVITGFGLPIFAQDAPIQEWTQVKLDAFKDTDDYRFRIAKSHGYIKAVGDFNGDGITDKAEISKIKPDGKYGLIAYVSNGAGKHTQHILKTGSFEDFSRLGINSQKPDTHKTWCGKLNNCKANEPAEITLKNEAISFFTFESAGGFYYYGEGKFNTVWTSD